MIEWVLSLFKRPTSRDRSNDSKDTNHEPIDYYKVSKTPSGCTLCGCAKKDGIEEVVSPKKYRNNDIDEMLMLLSNGVFPVGDRRCTEESKIAVNSLKTFIECQGDFGKVIISQSNIQYYDPATDSFIISREQTTLFKKTTTRRPKAFKINCKGS